MNTSRDVGPVVGDVVVTKVSHHYHIGRVQADGTSIASLMVTNDRTEALELACTFSGGRQRVFLHDQAGTRDRVEIDCRNLPPTTEY